MPGTNEEEPEYVKVPSFAIQNPHAPWLRAPGVRLIETELMDVLAHVNFKKALLNSPAEMIRVARHFRLPAFCLEESAERHPAPATQVPKLRFRRPAPSKVAIKKRTAVANPNPVKPLSARPLSFDGSAEDFTRQFNTLTPAEVTALFKQHGFPLDPPVVLEAEDSHKGKVA